MSVLMRATDLIGRPLVTLDGEDVAQIKDIVYAGASGRIAGFTLAGRGLTAGPLRRAIPWEAVHGAGRDAIMISDGKGLSDRDEFVTRSDLREQDVLGSTVLTDTGTALGEVTDVIVEISSVADVVGYEIRTGGGLPPSGRTLLIPLPDTLAASGEAVVVPAEATEFVVDDLSAFGTAVTSFRDRLGGGI